MRHLRAIITIMLAFLLAPMAGDYFAAPLLAKVVGIMMIVHETWVLVFRKTPKDLAEEQRRLEEARRRVEQIKHEAAMMYLQPGVQKSTAASSKFDVDKMAPHELANAARQIVQDIRAKKADKEGGAAAPMSKAA